MYDLTDTIVAVSSPTPDKSVIVRITGPDTIEKINQLFSPKVSVQNKGITHGRVHLADDFQIEATIYLFPEGHSYTGEDLAEIHFWSNPALTEAVLERLLAGGVRPAEAGEFTARAYLNGKMDLAQAEAVNKVITSSNRLQLKAAEKLLAGRLTETTVQVSKEILDILSLLEAGMDFSEEDIEFISRTDAVKRIEAAKKKLEQLLSGSISFEAVMDLPAVGIAGAVNAGKSSLLNKLLGRQRSIVSPQRKTTRDVLTGIVESAHNRYVIFDCAGLTAEAQDQIDVLAQQAAVEALNGADVVIFCVDIAKKDLGEDLAVWDIFRRHCERPILTATKADLLSTPDINERISQLKTLFGCVFFPISSHTGFNLDELKVHIDGRLDTQYAALGAPFGERTTQYGLALTARHKQSVTEAAENLSQAVDELEKDDNEIAAMLLRAACESLSGLEREHIDEQILDNIFSQFCIGK
jgi:tRNA modification GTPase